MIRESRSLLAVGMRSGKLEFVGNVKLVRDCRT